MMTKAKLMGIASAMGLLGAVALAQNTPSGNMPMVSSGIQSPLPVAQGGTGTTTSTGSGATVRATSPTLVTPNIGAASGTSLTTTAGIGSTLSIATGPAFDLSSQSQITVATGSNTAIVTGPYAFLYAVERGVTGDGAVYLIANNNVALLGSSILGDWVAPTTTPSAGKFSIQFDGATSIRVYNNQGAMITVRIAAIRLL